MPHVFVPDLEPWRRRQARHAVNEMHTWFKSCRDRDAFGAIDSWAAVYRHMFRKGFSKYFILRYLRHIDYEARTLPADDSFYVTLPSDKDYIP